MILKVICIVLLIGLSFVGVLELTLNSSNLFLTKKYYQSKAKKRVKQYIKENSFEIERIRFIQDKLNSLPMKMEKREDVLSRLSEFGNIMFLDYDGEVIEPCSSSFSSKLATIRFIAYRSSVEYDFRFYPMWMSTILPRYRSSVEYGFRFYPSACRFYCDEKIAIIDIPKHRTFEGRTMILVIEDNSLLPVYYAWQECTLREFEEKSLEQPNLKIIKKFFGLEVYREGDWISYIQNDVRKKLQETTYPSFEPIET